MLSYETLAATLGDDPDQSLAATWLTWGTPANWSPGEQVGQTGLPITRRAWSVPIYNATNSTNGSNTERLVYRAPEFYDQPARWSTITAWPVRLPWRTGTRAWATGEGTDNIALVDLDVNGTTGYECQNLRAANIVDAFLYALVGITLPEGAYVVDQIALRTPANIGQYVGHGAGKIPKRAGILTATMARDGVTEALSLVGWNVQHGPGAIFRAPATRVEHPTDGRAYTGLPTGNVSTMVPHGTRLRLDYTTGELAAWAAAAHPDSEPRQLAAYNVALGLVRYGMVQDETGGSTKGSDETAQIESSGDLPAGEAAIWSTLDMTTDAHFVHLLDGLFVTGRVKVVRQPGEAPTPTPGLPVKFPRRVARRRFVAAALDD